MFSPEERLTRHGELSIRPREDVTIHLLFAPTRVACMLAKLEIKQSGVRSSQPGVKFTVRMWLFRSCFVLWLLLCSDLTLHFPHLTYSPSTNELACLPCTFSSFPCLIFFTVSLTCFLISFLERLGYSLIWFSSFPSSDSTVWLRWDEQHNPRGPEKTGRWLCGNADWHRC